MLVKIYCIVCYIPGILYLCILMAPDISPLDVGDAASVWIGEVMRLVAGGTSAEGVESGLRAHFGKRQGATKVVDFIVKSWTHVKKQNEQIRTLKRSLAEMSATAVSSQNEVIGLQKRVIDIQQQHIDQAATTVGENVRDTLSEEIKLYSTALANKAAEAAVSQTPKQQTSAPTVQVMTQAVKFAAEENERSKRLIFFGIQDSSENLDEDENAAVEALGIDPMFDSSVKLGTRKPGLSRPVLVTVRDAAHATEILRKSHLLRRTDLFKSVYISPDRSLEQRKIHRELVNELTQRRAEKLSGDEKLRFVIRDGRVVSLPRE